MILLYKASAIAYKNQPSPYDKETIINYQSDFEVTVNKLTKDQLIWLYDSLRKSYPSGHKWINVIEQILN